MQSELDKYLFAYMMLIYIIWLVLNGEKRMMIDEEFSGSYI